MAVYTKVFGDLGYDGAPAEHQCLEPSDQVHSSSPGHAAIEEETEGQSTGRRTEHPSLVCPSSSSSLLRYSAGTLALFVAKEGRLLETEHAFRSTRFACEYDRHAEDWISANTVEYWSHRMNMPGTSQDGFACSVEAMQNHFDRKIESAKE